MVFRILVFKVVRNETDEMSHNEISTEYNFVLRALQMEINAINLRNSCWLICCNIKVSETFWTPLLLGAQQEDWRLSTGKQNCVKAVKLG